MIVLSDAYNKQEYTDYLKWLASSNYCYHLDDGGKDGSGLDDIIWQSAEITEEDLRTLKKNHQKLVSLIPSSDWSKLEDYYYELLVTEQ